jgi:DNA helicase-2/ATP-dependent DNA helicase PcrA
MAAFETDPLPHDRATPPAPPPPYLADLNPEQRAAVEILDGPLLVLAGAGTGKTRVLTTRIAHLLWTRRARPGQILAVTFTNKAAREMQERVGGLIGGTVEGMEWLGTFHAIGARILRRHAELVDLKSNFTILDTDDQIRLLKQVLVAADVEERRWPARQLAALIDRWKNRGLTPDRVPEEEAFAFADGQGASLYRRYQERLKIVNAADFGDLVLECLRLFLNNPDVIESWQRRFRYVLVDEYQDTNVAQYLWLRLLAQGTRGREGGESRAQNICCVGDDDQSIYGWRGAEVGNILRFESDFPGARIIRLERNYRSTPHILGAASGLIRANEGRFGKTLWTERAASGERVVVRGLWDGEEEARMVGEEVEALHAVGHPLGEMAVLVRAGFQTREFEERFLTLGIPYRMVGGLRFYERAEIRDAIAYLRVIAQPEDGLAFERILNTPKRGLGNATVQAMHRLARIEAISLPQAARLLIGTDEVTARARTALRRLIEDFDRWRGLRDEVPHPDLARIVLDESGYTAMWQNDRSPDAPGRLENLKELVRAMEEFENLAGFLEHIALVMDNAQDESEDKINLMTLHAAKGLEFRTVFLPGWEEGLFPHQRSLDQSGLAGLEEERRLAYVGLTRAKQRALVSFAANRRVHSLWQSAIPSRFIDELPREHVQIESGPGLYQGRHAATGFGVADIEIDPDYVTPGQRRARAARGAGLMAREPDWRRFEAPAATAAPYKGGERVFHQKFGYGRVVGVDGAKLHVMFDKAGTKKVVASFVERA